LNYASFMPPLSAPFTPSGPENREFCNQPHCKPAMPPLSRSTAHH
jgi:hypothetical protein